MEDMDITIIVTDTEVTMDTMEDNHPSPFNPSPISHPSLVSPLAYRIHPPLLSTPCCTTANKQLV